MIKEIQGRFIKMILENPEKYNNDYLYIKEKVKNSTAIYMDKPVSFLYQALFFSEKEYNQLKKLLSELISILNKVVLEYKENSVFRAYFRFNQLLEELILVDPGYQYFFPIGRFDIFYKEDGEHIFCELNTDGSSAMNEVRVIQEYIKNSQIVKDLLKDNDILTGFELFYSWTDELINNYKEYNNGFDDRPNIAIIDFKGDGTIYEFKEFQKRFVDKGYKTFICDPGELKYRKSVLYYKDYPIKLIYRRATTNRLLEEAANITDLLSAYRDGAVCLIGGFVSEIVHNKILFAILHDYDKTAFLNKREREFINRHIPYTKIINFADNKLINEITNNKDRWILKPFDQYAGKGVYAGKDFNQDEWNKTIEKIKSRDYIVQEFIDISKLEMVNLEDRKKQISIIF